MGTEIERKFLVTDESWKSMAQPDYCCQGYLNPDPHRTVRVRIMAGCGWLTVKGATLDNTRPEFEYPVPVNEAQSMMKLCQASLIEKNRYSIRFREQTWEIDEFLGENAGLLIAEIELQSPDQIIEKPPWLGAEVSDDPRYFNSQLAQNPFRRWHH